MVQGPVHDQPFHNKAFRGPVNLSDNFFNQADQLRTNRLKYSTDHLLTFALTLMIHLLRIALTALS